jgi:hypothetical protein
MKKPETKRAIAAVREALAECYRERAAKPRRLSYVRVEQVDKDTKRPTVFTFLWK